MIPIVFGLGGLIARVAAAAVIPRIVSALARSLESKDPVRRLEVAPLRENPAPPPAPPVAAPVPEPVLGRVLGSEKQCFKACRYTGSYPINFSDPWGLERWRVDRADVRQNHRYWWGSLNQDHGSAESGGPLSPEWAAEGATGQLVVGGAIKAARAFRGASEAVATGVPKLGGFASEAITTKAAQVTTNRFNGKLWEKEASELVRSAYPASQGYKVVVGGKGVWTPAGFRFPDITVTDLSGNAVRYFEAKFYNGPRFLDRVFS